MEQDSSLFNLSYPSTYTVPILSSEDPVSILHLSDLRPALALPHPKMLQVRSPRHAQAAESDFEGRGHRLS